MTNSAIDNSYFDMLPNELETCLDAVPIGCKRPEVTSGLEDFRLAAVLVPLIWRRSVWQILMTKRAAHLQHHAGQISFPGGKLDPKDAGLAEAALREAREEIGLAPSMVRVVGALSSVCSPAGFVVQPIVGVVDRDIFDNLCPEPAEVECIFTLPLMHIAQPNNFKLVPSRSGDRKKSYWVVSHPRYHIWGLSARILNDLRSRLYHCYASQ